MSKRIFPQTLLGRFVVILITPLVAIQLFLGFFFIERHTDTILRTLARTIAGEVSLLVHLIDHGIPENRVTSFAREHLEMHAVFLPTSPLKRIGVYRDTWLYGFLNDAFTEHLRRPYFLRMTHQYLRVTIPTLRGNLEIQMPRKRFFSRTTPHVLIGTGICAVVMAFIAFLFMRNQIRSIRRLAKAADAFGKGGSIDFKPEGALEVRRAGYAFLMMQERITRHLSQRRDMLAGVSHDLRTPLTRMKLQLACLEATEPVMFLETEVKRMQRMVETFLTYTRQDVEEAMQPILLKSFFEEILDALSLSHDILTCPEAVYADLRPQAFERVIVNLLTNAQRYAENILMGVISFSDGLSITIDDDGVGIPPEERENVFQPFYRIDAARNVDEGGVGLGLHIVKDIIQSHGGTITLETVPKDSHAQFSRPGLRVLIWIPK